MDVDKYGIPYCSTEELCGLLYSDPELALDSIQVSDASKFNASKRALFYDTPALIPYFAPLVTVEEFDKLNQSDWFMPDEYKNLDIAKWLIDQCRTEEELQRVGKELMMYQDRDLMDLLKFMKYFVDTLRKEKIVWGVGRGSSVSSYVLFLLQVHRIDSIYYDLDVEEFLK